MIQMRKLKAFWTHDNYHLLLQASKFSELHEEIKLINNYRAPAYDIFMGFTLKQEGKQYNSYSQSSTLYYA